MLKYWLRSGWPTRPQLSSASQKLKKVKFAEKLLERSSIYFIFIKCIVAGSETGLNECYKQTSQPMSPSDRIEPVKLALKSIKTQSNTDCYLQLLRCFALRALAINTNDKQKNYLSFIKYLRRQNHQSNWNLPNVNEIDQKLKKLSITTYSKPKEVLISV